MPLLNFQYLFPSFLNHPPYVSDCQTWISCATVAKAAGRTQDLERESINIRGKYLLALLHAYPRTRDNVQRRNERTSSVCMLPMYPKRGYERDTLVVRGFGPGGGYTAAKLQCPATHNAATAPATVIMLVLTARLRSRRWNYRC